MLSAPPDTLSASGLVIWMAVAIVSFYSAMTIFIVPHMSLGAELTDDYRYERNKIFSARAMPVGLPDISALCLPCRC